jgi:hypothetical protein
MRWDLDAEVLRVGDETMPTPNELCGLTGERFEVLPASGKNSLRSRACSDSRVRDVSQPVAIDSWR